MLEEILDFTKSIFVSVKKLIKNTGGFFVFKGFCSFIFTLLIGSRAIVFLTNIATYIYADYHKIRFPSEGVLYSNALKPMAVLFVPFTATLIFFIVFRMLKFLEKQSNTTPLIVKFLKKVLGISETFKTAHVVGVFKQYCSENSVSYKRIFTASIISTFLFMLLVYGILKISNVPSAFLVVVASTLVTWMLILILWDQKFFWYIPFSITLLSYLAGLSFFCYPQNYASFLRKIKHGGGIPIAIEAINQSGLNKKALYNGFLMLITNESYFIYIPKESKIHEIKSYNIYNISYSTNQEKEFKLPR